MQPSRCLGLGEEAVDFMLALRTKKWNLQGNFAIEVWIVGLIDTAECTLAKQFFELKAAEGAEIFWDIRRRPRFDTLELAGVRRSGCDGFGGAPGLLKRGGSTGGFDGIDNKRLLAGGATSALADVRLFDLDRRLTMR